MKMKVYIIGEVSEEMDGCVNGENISYLMYVYTAFCFV